MQYRPGQASDFTHLETFVWQAIFPAFDVPGLTDEQRRENDLMVEESRAAALDALKAPTKAVFTAWDERRRALAGYLIVDTGAGKEFAQLVQLVVRRADWGHGVGGKLVELGIDHIGRHRPVVLSVRAYNARAIALFQKMGFVDSGESGGDFAIERVLMIREAELTAPVPPAAPSPSEVVEELAPFPSEDDEPYYEELPDYSLATDTLAEPVFDPEQSSLDEQQMDQLETFIARAKAIKAGKEVPAPVVSVKQVKPAKQPDPEPSVREAPAEPPKAPPVASRHPDIELEIVTGAEEDSITVEAAEAIENVVPPSPLAFEFAFGPTPASPQATCANCGAAVPAGAVFCPNCGHRLGAEEDLLDLEEIPVGEAEGPEPEASVPPIVGETAPKSEITPLELRGELEDRLGERLSAYFGAEVLPDYLKRYRRDEDFHRIRDVSLQGLARYLNTEAVSQKMARRRRRDTLGELVEYFVVESGRAVHGDELFNQRLLRYQGADWKQVDLFRLVKDYLQLDGRELRVYTDFVTTPPKVLRNATASYLRAGRDERVFFIVDQSLFGSGKHGFALTDSNLYWKNVLQPAGSTTYTTLTFVEMREGHLMIDGQYFDAGRTVNLRVALLLDKLRRMDLSE